MGLDLGLHPGRPRNPPEERSRSNSPSQTIQTPSSKSPSRGGPQLSNPNKRGFSSSEPTPATLAPPARLFSTLPASPIATARSSAVASVVRQEASAPPMELGAPDFRVDSRAGPTASDSRSIRQPVPGLVPEARLFRAAGCARRGTFRGRGLGGPVKGGASAEGVVDIRAHCRRAIWDYREASLSQLFKRKPVCGSRARWLPRSPAWPWDRPVDVANILDLLGFSLATYWIGPVTVPCIFGISAKDRPC